MRRILHCLILFCCMGTFALSPPHAQAATLTVTNLSDGTSDGTCDAAGTGDGCTLREAITAANADADQTDIVFADGLTGTITLTTALPDVATSLSIRNTAATPLTLARSGATGTLLFSVLTVSAGTVQLQGLTLTGGSAGPSGKTSGGGLHNEAGIVTLSSCTLSNNKASSLGGGLFNNKGMVTLLNCTLSGNSSDSLGGGIMNTDATGKITLNSCTLSGNAASQGGGIDNQGTVELSNCIVAGNSLNNGTASDIVTGKNLTSNGYNLVGVVNGSFTAPGDQTGVTLAQLKLNPLQNNGGPTPTRAIGRGSIAFNAGNPSVEASPTLYDQRGNPFQRVFYGRIDVGAYEYQGPLTGFNESLVVTTLTDEDDGTSDPAYGSGTSLREALIYANSDPDQSTITFSSGVAGGTFTLTQALPDLTTSLNIRSSVTSRVTLARSDASGTLAFRIFTIGNGTTTGPTVALTGLTLVNGSGQSGGAIESSYSTLTLDTCAFSRNKAANGGGGLHNVLGSTTLTRCTFGSNTASYGGGLSSQGQLTVADCAFIGNTGGSGAIDNNNGSTLALTGCTLSGNTGGPSIVNFTTATLNNCTISGNTSSGQGGGILNYMGTVTVNSSTITGNMVTSGGGGGIFSGSGSGTKTTLINSIVVGNTSSDPDTYSDLDTYTNANTFVSGGYNLLGTTSTNALTTFTATTHDHTGIASAQLKLGTLTNNGGPTQTIALGVGSIAIDTGNTDLTTDQRGVRRPFGSADDVGAYEFSGTLSLVVTTLADEDDGTSDPTVGAGTSLREAINAASFDPNTNDTITFAPGLAGGTLTLVTALPDITSGLSILNPAAQSITLVRSSAVATTAFKIVYVGNGTTPGPVVALTGLTLTNGTTLSSGSLRDTQGGGLYNENGKVTLTNCILTGNTANSGDGAGFYNRNGTVTLLNCTVADNLAAFRGGGFYNTGAVTLTNCTLAGNTARRPSIPAGLGVYSYGGGFNNVGTATLTNCTIAGNTATAATSNSDASSSAYGYGGGLYNSGSITLTNCTVVGNTASTSASGSAFGYGGGLYNMGAALLTNCTITSNTATNNNGSGIGVSAKGGSTTLSNNIVAANTNSDLDITDGTTNTFTSRGYNLVGTSGTNALTPFNKIGDVTGVTTDQLKFGPLQNNGGPTQTIALQVGSIAINAGNTDLATDQRGVKRPQGGVDDVGAYEFTSTFNESLVVTTLADEDDGTSDPTYGNGTSLREAINYANTNADQSDITFDPSLVGKTITLTRALTDITSSLSITNPATQSITLMRSSAATTANFNILVVYGSGRDSDPSTAPTGPSVALRGLTLTNGRPGVGSGEYRSIGGGGLYVENSTVNLITCTLSDNISTAYGGGLFNDGGTVTLTNSTVANNSANNYGGGISTYIGMLNLTNSTLANNTSAYPGGNGGGGGGLHADNSTVTFSSCTITGNTAAANRGSGILNLDANITLSNSIVAENTYSDLDIFAGGTTTYTSSGYNLVGISGTDTLVAFKQTGDQTGVTGAQLKLGPLADNGGPTQTIALQPGSIALNAGNTDLTTDQRGVARPQGSADDVGAYESPSTILKGTVYNAAARAGLSGIKVQALLNDGSVAAQTLTDSNGQYTLELVPAVYTLAARKEDNANFRFRPDFNNPVTLTSTGGVGYNFRSIGIGGRVISPANMGIGGVTLSLYAGASTTATTTLNSDTEGFFSFDGLTAGTWKIVPTVSPNYAYTPTSRTLMLADKALFTSFTAAAKINYALSGKVSIFNNGALQGLAGVTLKAIRASDNTIFTATTGNDGTYVLPNLTAGTYTLAPQNAGLTYTYAPAPSNQTQPLVLTAQSPSKSGLNFVAKPLISGRVYNAVALAGLSGIVVKATRQSDGVVFAAGTDSEGRYSLSLDPGTYTLMAFLPHKDGFIINPVFTNPVTIKATVPASVPSYDFRALGVTGRVISTANVGIPGVTINLYAQNDTALKSPLRTSTTDSNGFFSLDGVAAGTWLVVPVAPNTYSYTPATRTVTVANAAVFTSFTAKAKSATKSMSGLHSPIVLSTASADMTLGTLTLKFTGPLDAASVQEFAHYRVGVNGTAVSIENAQLSDGDTIVLTLPEGALTNGSQIVVSWAGVLDTQGLPLQGQSILTP